MGSGSRTRRLLLLLPLLTGCIGLLVDAAAQASVESEIAFHRGVAAYGAGRLDEARKAFEVVVAEDPEDAAAIHYLGLIAQAKVEMERAVELYQRVLELEPDNLDAKFDLATAYVELRRSPEALALFEEVIAVDPENADAYLYAGIASYRVGNHEQAVAYLKRAVELDPQLRVHAAYYAGLAEAFQGNYGEATGALDEVIAQSPTGPLADSARNMREQFKPPPPERRWAVSLTGGMEYDSNPTLAGIPVTREDDGRGVVRIRSSVLAYQNGGFALSAGYDGYLSAHIETTELDLSTHVLNTSATYSRGNVQLNLRYDFAYTWIDLTRPFRLLHRVSPSIAFRQRDIGVTQAYYSFNYENYYLPLFTDALNRDGPRQTVGVNQYLFTRNLLPVPYLQYLRVGAMGDFYNPRGTEFEYRGWEVSLGFGMTLPWEIEFAAIFRYVQRDFQNESVIQPGTVRFDEVQILSVDVSRPIDEHWEVSVGTTANFNTSNVDVFDFNRVVAGAYVTYQF